MTQLMDKDDFFNTFPELDKEPYNKFSTVEPTYKPIAQITFDNDKLKELTDDIIEKIKNGELVLKREEIPEEYKKLKAENSRLTHELEQAYEQIINLKFVLSGVHEKPKTAREAAEAEGLTVEEFFNRKPSEQADEDTKGMAELMEMIGVGGD